MPLSQDCFTRLTRKQALSLLREKEGAKAPDLFASLCANARKRQENWLRYTDRIAVEPIGEYPELSRVFALYACGQYCFCTCAEADGADYYQMLHEAACFMLKGVSS